MSKLDICDYTAQRALYVGTMPEFSFEQHHDLISTTFQRCSNFRCPQGGYSIIV